MAEDNILWLKEISKESIPLVGGKGANLGEMIKIGNIPIPATFVVTAQAYKKFIEENKIGDEINSILKNLDVDDADKLHDAAKKVQEIILNAEMPGAIKNDIIESYDNLNVDLSVFKYASKEALDIIKTGRDNPFVAVRSSATAEDLPSISEDEYVLVKVDNRTYFRKVKEINDLVGDGSGYDIEIPAMKDDKIQWVKVGSLYKHKVKNGEKLFKIKTETGREIIVSPNHSLIILDENKLQPKQIKSVRDLDENKKIPTINRLPILDLKQEEINILDYIDDQGVVEQNGFLMIKNKSNNWKIQSEFPKKIKITKDFAYFLGIYCAEGSIYGNNGISITNGDMTIIKRVINFISSLGLYNDQKINKNSLRFYNKTFARFLSSIAGELNPDIKGKGKICRNKKVPEFIFSWNKYLIGEFLKGCFDGDGFAGKNTLQYTSTSKVLVSGIIKLLEMLGIEWYLRERNSAFDITIQPYSFQQFSNLISFESKIKQKRLNALVKGFKERKNHPEFLNSISVSNQLSKYLRKKFEENLPKKKILVNFCSVCNNKLEKNSNYLNKKRFYCKNCHKTLYEGSILKKEIEQYVNYDLQGRFIKNEVPWNKGLICRRLGIKQFKKLLNKNNIRFNVLNDSIKWDSIKKITEIDYNGYVYDFCIPEVENFAAGVGGIITHNSASFAGQQATFLNVKGGVKLLRAVHKCWASLFTARAIYYRIKNNFPHEKVLIAVIVQKMVNSAASGVIFTANPTTNNLSEIVIEAGYGLGEAVVSGSITPDSYIVDKETLKIKEKKINKQTFAILRDVNTGENVKRTLFDEEGTNQKLTDGEIKKLARYAIDIERHYKKPQDIEFAIENSSIFIVQSRPITTIKEQVEIKEINKEVILEGIAASPYIGSGAVKIINGPEELNKIEQGDVLVTKMTNPDYTAGMQKAAAIVTDEGGRTSHAAIVSREMGISCVVGTMKATKILKEGDIVTVDGSRGKVYAGKVEVEENVEEEGKELIVADSEVEKKERVLVDTKVYMNLGEPDEIDRYKELGFDGIGLMRIEFLIADKIKEHPNSLIEKGEEEKYINGLSNGILKVAEAIGDKPLIVRFSDFKSNEYRDLEGGEKYEPHENNPMIGWRGVSRYISEEFEKAFRLECRAINKVREKVNNVHVMLPFVRTVWEVDKVLVIMKEEGLERNDNFKVLLMAEVPSMALIPEEFAKLDIDGCSIGSNDLTQLILGVGRDSAILGKMGYFDERNLAVLRGIKNIINGFKNNGKSVSICGQAPSEFPEFVKFLVKNGIDSISVNPDVVEETKKLVEESK